MGKMTDAELRTRRRERWLRDMLAMACNLLSQAGDLLIDCDIEPTTGPKGDPDRYNIQGFLDAVRERYPNY